jgi:tetratricopeptide (TPR) repeat protein
MRQYARERLDETTDAEVWRARHSDYYLELARRAEQGSRGPDELASARIVAADLANFRAVLDWSVATGRADDALRLCLALGPFAAWNTTRTLSGWFAVALAIPGGHDLELRAHVAVWDAWANNFTTRHLAGVRERATFMEHAHRDARIPPNALALQTLALLASLEARWPEALGLLDDAFAAGDRIDRALILFQKAMFLVALGQSGDALEVAEQAVEAAHEIDSVTYRAGAESALGAALADIDPERAIFHLERSRAAGHAVGDVCVSVGARRLARLRAARGDLAGALAVYAEELALVIPELDHLTAGLTCESLAVDLSRTDHYDTAAVLFGALDAPADDYQGNPAVGRPAAIAALRNRIGDRHYQTLADRGRAMTTTDMLDYARTETRRLLNELSDE